MYSGSLSNRDRAGPVTAVILVHLALAALLASIGAGPVTTDAAESRIKIFDIRELPPPPPDTVPPPQQPRKAAPKRAPAPAAPRAEASAVQLLPPRVELPPLNPIVTAPVAGIGAAPSQGAATAGTGSGAGGVGSGAGGGAGGFGSGGGTHPRPLFRPLSPRNLPRDLVDSVPRGVQVFLLFTVQVDGRITDCNVRQSSGVDMVDATLCQIAEQRFRYDPARRSDGTPYVARAGYMQIF